MPYCRQDPKRDPNFDNYPCRYPQRPPRKRALGAAAPIVPTPPATNREHPKTKPSVRQGRISSDFAPDLRQASKADLGQGSFQTSAANLTHKTSQTLKLLAAKQVKPVSLTYAETWRAWTFLTPTLFTVRKRFASEGLRILGSEQNLCCVT